MPVIAAYSLLDGFRKKPEVLDICKGFTHKCRKIRIFVVFCQNKGPERMFQKLGNYPNL